MFSFVGKLQFADAQLWGRAGRMALHDLRSYGHLSREPVKVDATGFRALKSLKDRLLFGKPNTIHVCGPQKPVIVFTDGALEGSDSAGSLATIGAVLFDPSCKHEAHVFSCEVPEKVLAHWRSDGRHHVIGLVELYAAIVVLRHWRHRLEGKRVILFVDNWPALDALVRGDASVATWRELLLVLENPEETAPFYLWTARVPSKSNVADGPSKRLGSSSMLSGSDSRGRAQPWQKSTEPLALTSTREKCYGRLKTVKSKNGKKQGAAKPALSRKVQDFEGCLSPCRTMTWSKEDWRFSIQNSPSARFAIWSANTSRKRSFWQVYGLCTLALLVSTWELSSAPHAFQSWEKASLVSGTSIWDEPNNHELIGRGPTADAESERACKRVGEDVGRRNMTRFCVAVQVGWITFLDNCHHCNVCSRCLLAPCLCSQRTWPARIPLLAVREKTRHPPNVFQLQNRRFFLF